jgi:hypothetical protein
VKQSQALDAVRGIAIILGLIWRYMPTHVTPDLLVNSTRLLGDLSLIRVSLNPVLWSQIHECA